VLVDALALRTLAPDRRPIDITVRTGSGTNDLQHPFGRVSLDWKLGSTVAFEVAGKGRRLLANLAEVNCSSTLGEEQQTIETLEKHRRRLVDGAENSLAVLGQGVNEIENGPGSLRIKTGSGLIEEQKQLGLGSKLDTDSQTLTLLDVET
jgi:hypothetical protein